MSLFEYSKNQGHVYVIFSVDTEHDIIARYATRSAGWSKGIPLLFDIFDVSGLRSKVCWLIEYNLKDGIVSANPNSEFYVKEFPELITQIKSRGDELGLHPSMVDWLGGEKYVSTSSYNDPDLWDNTKRYNDPEFVIDLITSAKKEFIKVCGVNPVGCRTGGMQYATHLATALAKNGLYIDSTVSKGRLKPWELVMHNAYYASSDDIRQEATTKTNVLEIPTVGYIQNNRLLDLWMRLRCRYWMQRQGPLFLSFFIHNWQAITFDGGTDTCFLKTLSSFLHQLSNHGAQFLSWTEAYETYKSISVKS